MDISQRTAEPAGGNDEVESVVRVLREFYPYGFSTSGGDGFRVTWGDELAEKRLRDLLRDSAAGRESPAEEDAAMARLRQSREEDERFWNDPGEWSKRLPKRL